MKGLLVAELTSKTLRRRGKGSSDDKKKAEKDGKDDDATKGDAANADGKVMNILTADFEKVATVGAFLDAIYILPLKLVI
ncbi:hypothetical protein LPJ81_004689, partial [Coemansia sp. IMI 209127]